VSSRYRSLVAVAFREIDLTAVIVALFGSLAIVVPVWLTTFVRTGRVRSQVAEVKDAVGTPNGAGSVSSEVREVVKSVEVLHAQMHTNTRELVDLADRQVMIEEKLDHHRGDQRVTLEVMRRQLDYLSGAVDRLRDAVEQLERGNR